MAATKLRIRKLGPISEADIAFGDLTVLTGPQASGKSVALQTLTLALDRTLITRRMHERGLVWRKDRATFLDLFYGTGMRTLWGDDTEIALDGRTLTAQHLIHLPTPGEVRPERVSYVPAQRIMSIRDGWTRAFGDYQPGDPYVLRAFSQDLHDIVQGELSSHDRLFPRQQRFNEILRSVAREHVLGGWELHVDAALGQKRFVIQNSTARSDEKLTFLSWSTGQREFVPLLLGLYRLLPPGAVSRRDDLEWVVIEELEMGLHPRAIAATMAFVMELLRRGYRVALSTHSTQVLDVVWGLHRVAEFGGRPHDVLEMLGLPRSRAAMDAAAAALTADRRVYYFESGQLVRDISDLDPLAEDDATAGWGGLSQFSERVARTVSRLARVRSLAQEASSR